MTFNISHDPIDRAELRIGDDRIFFDGSRPFVIGSDANQHTVFFELDHTIEADKVWIERFKRWMDAGYYRHCEFAYINALGGGRIEMEFRVHAMAISDTKPTEVTLMVRPRGC